MAIPNIVPRANDDGETLGKSTKQWSNVYTKDLTVNGSSLTSLIAGKANSATVNALSDTVSTHTAQLAGTASSALKEQILQKVDKENPKDSEDNAILTEADVLTLEEIEASTELADTDVANADTIKWKFKGATSGAGEVGLPTSYQELNVCVNCQGYSWVFTVPKKYIAQWSGTGVYRGGYYGGAADYWDCTIRITGGVVYIQTSMLAGIDQKAATAIYVLYR